MSRQQRRHEMRMGIRTVGFTAYPSRRTMGAHAAEVIRLIGTGMNPANAEWQAWRNLAATLPVPRMVKNYRAKPSKSDDPAYRKSIWPVRKVEARFERECFEYAADLIRKRRAR